jgi:hypothetical protein
MSQFQNVPQASGKVLPTKAGFNFLHDENGPIPVPAEHMPSLYKTLGENQVAVEIGEQSKRAKQENARKANTDPSLKAFPGQKGEIVDPKTSY